MSGLRQFFFRLGGLFRKHRLEAEMSAELREHLELRIEQNIEHGMTPEEARYAALRSFGGVEQVKELCRDQRTWACLEDLAQDCRYAIRSLRKSPGFAAVTVLSLGLGIGANTALFSLLDELLLRSLPVKKPQELVLFRWLANNAPFEGILGRSGRDAETGLWSDTALSYPIFEQLRSRATMMSEVFAFAPLYDINVTVDDRTEPVAGQVVSGNYFSALGVSAFRGRMLTMDDERPSAAPAAVLAYRYWQQKLGGDEAVLGKVIKVNQVNVTIVGIMPRDFIGALQAGEAPDVTLPLSCEPQLRSGLYSFLGRPLIWWLHVMSRLQPGVDITQAEARLEPVLINAARDAWNQAGPRQADRKVEHRDMPRLRLEAGGQGLMESRRDYARPLAILTGMVGLVLLLACVNVANLLLTRATARRREMAVRLSVGASRGRIIRQLLTESAVLALSGGALGVLFAWWGRAGLLHLWPMGDGGALSLDGRILGFTAGLSLITGLLFGLAPAWESTRVDLNSALKGGSGKGGRRTRSALRGGLTVAQVGLSMLLLIGAGLFLGTLRNLRGIDAGFNRSGLVLFQASARPAGYSDTQAADLFERMRERIQVIPGVKEVAFANYGLLTQQESSGSIIVDNPRLPADLYRGASGDSVSPEFRRTMGIPLLLGRDLTSADRRAARAVALVNEEFARTYFPGESPLGHRITFPGRASMGSQDLRAEIVGVIGNVHVADLRAKISPTVFTAFAQDARGDACFAVRTALPPEALADSIRAAVREVEPAVPVRDLRTQEEQVDLLYSRERLFAVLSSLFGGLALMLACIGLYGLLTNEVTVRTKEIGIRRALGAQVPEIIGLVMRRGLGLAVLGCLIGFAGALALTHFVGGFLYGVVPTDAFNFLSAGIVLLVVAGIACWLPARRAAKVDPMVALRCE